MFINVPNRMDARLLTHTNMEVDILRECFKFAGAFWFVRRRWRREVGGQFDIGFEQREILLPYEEVLEFPIFARIAKEHGNVREAAKAVCNLINAAEDNGGLNDVAEALVCEFLVRFFDGTARCNENFPQRRYNENDIVKAFADEFSLFQGNVAYPGLVVAYSQLKSLTADQLAKLVVNC